jgi:hypothetical protein
MQGQPAGRRALTSLAFGTLGATLLTVAVACAPAQSSEAPAIASVHKRQCGRCHSPPEAGKRSKAYLEEALGPHHKRVHMTDQEWSQMIDYLAAEGSGG